MKTILLTGLALLLSASSIGVLAATPAVSERDAEIERSAKTSYVFRNFLKYDPITVCSTSGCVTITGTVTDALRRSLAEDTVASILGVTNIENRLIIRSESQGEESDGLAYSRMKTAFRCDRDLGTCRIAVDVKHGLATLCGTTTASLQREKAARIANDIPGVTEVKNLIELRSVASAKREPIHETIDDASITAMGKSALLMHRSTAGVAARIQTTQGVITAVGTAKTLSDKAAVTRILNDMIGIQVVANQMQVDSTASQGGPPLPPTGLRIVVQ